MVAIESTPAMVARVYATTAKNLDVVRRRLGRPLSLADKLLLGHLDDPAGQDLAQGDSQLALRPDRVALQDVLGQTVMLNFMQTRRESAAVPPPSTATTSSRHASRAASTSSSPSRRTTRSTPSSAPPPRSSARASGAPARA